MKYAGGFAFPDCDELMSREIKPDGTYQLRNLLAALGYVRDRSVAIDGGAHVGTWSRLLSKEFARVIAVEPSPDTFEALTVNMRAFNCANVELRNVALGAELGTVTMVLNGRGAELANTGARQAIPGGPIICEAIDVWSLPSLGLLKLDIEGSEPDALMGAITTLKRCRPVVIFENKYLWARYGLARDAPQAILRSLGYAHVATASCDEIWTPIE